jgi:hypothetical protein
MKYRYLVVGALAAVSLGACGSSSTNASGSISTSTTVSNGSTTASVTTTTAAASGRTLPAPCALLTKTDVAPLFGTTDLSVSSSVEAANGTAECSYSLRVGVQGLGVSVRTRTGYANDPSYVFPQEGTSVAGIGDLARITPVQAHSADITVKLGGNAISIHVEFYTKPIDNAFLTRLARDAVSRI